MKQTVAPAFDAVGPEARAAVLEHNRTTKMARSAHAYVRGNTVQFYEWLESGSARSLPEGPSVWICGDCHVGNLGPVASAAWARSPTPRAESTCRSATWTRP